MPRNVEPVVVELDGEEFKIKKLTFTQMMSLYRDIGIEDITDVEETRKKASLHADTILRKFFPELCVSHDIGPDGDYDVDDFDFEEQTKIFNALLKGLTDLDKGVEQAGSFLKDKPE